MSCATRSAPEQKPLPAPVITSTRSSRLLATSSNTSRRPPHIAPVIALSLSGRLSVSVTTPSRRSTRRSSDIGRYRSGVGLNPFRSQAKRGSDVVIVVGRARGGRGAGALGRVRLSASPSPCPRTAPTCPTDPSRSATSSRTRREGVPLPGLRPRDPARRRPRGRGAARRARGPPPLAHVVLATRRDARRDASTPTALRTRLSITSTTGGAPRAASTDATSKRSVPRRVPRVLVEPAHRRACGSGAACVTRDRLGRRAERGAAARLHLAEHEHAVARDARGRARPRGSASCGRARS